MDFKSEILETLKKKALGYSYEEVVLEYENSATKPWILCLKRKRVYGKKGYLCLKKVEKLGVFLKNKVFFANFKKKLTQIFENQKFRVYNERG